MPFMQPNKRRETGRKSSISLLRGRKLTQAGVTELATNQKLILVAGRYEGIDERVIQTEVDEEWSIGLRVKWWRVALP